MKKFLILFVCLFTIWGNFKVFYSSLFQAYIMYDYNHDTFNVPIDLIKDAPNVIPNVTLTTIPIKFLQARYYEELDSIEVAKKMYFESININPYLRAVEAELSGLYFDQEQYDSAYYYSKIAFDAIPNSNVHRHAYFQVLTEKKDTIALLQAFNILKKYDNNNHWKEYLLKRYEIVGPQDNQIIELLEEYKNRFGYENDKPTKVLESILVSGSKNVVISVAFSLKADTLFKEKDYENAAKLYELAFELDSKDYVFYENAAIAYNLAGNHEKAELYFDKVIDDFKPMNGKSEFYKGIMLIKLNRNEEGCMLLKRAVELKFSGEGSITVYNNFCN